MAKTFTDSNLIRLLKDIFFDGFDTFADYEKYGDAFIEVEKVEEKNKNVSIVLYKEHDSD